MTDSSEFAGMTEPKPTYTVSNPRLHLGPYLATLTCRACHSPLGMIVEWNKKTAVMLTTAEGHPVLVFRARLLCACGAARMFYSMPTSGIRLGIEE
jgi:hypothetical protein